MLQHRDQVFAEGVGVALAIRIHRAEGIADAALAGEGLKPHAGVEVLTGTDVTIGAGVTEIGVDAFEDCASLTSIVIPKAVRFIKDGAFKGCSGLREITISRRFEDDLERIFKDVDLSEVKINWL